MTALILALMLAAPTDAPVSSGAAPTEPPLMPALPLAPPSPALRSGGSALMAAGITAGAISGLLGALLLANIVPLAQANRNVGEQGYLMLGGAIALFVGSVGAAITGRKMILWYRTLNEQHAASPPLLQP